DPLVGEGIAAQLRRGRRLGQVALVDRRAYPVVGLVEIDQLAAVGQADGAALHVHAPAAMISSPTAPASTSRPASGRPSSVTKACASVRAAIVAMPTVSHFVLSATTTSRAVAAISARSVSASSRF